MDTQQAQDLLHRYLSGEGTPEERLLLEQWYNQQATSVPPMPGISEQAVKAIEQEIRKRLPAGQWKPRAFFRPVYYIPVAALLLIALAVGLYFYRSKAIVPDITPGGNRATLTLADGTKINLDSAKTGIQINDEYIVYNDKTPLNVILSGERGDEGKGAEGSMPTSLTLSTPKGGQYQIILSDGTKVWLNAESTLKYPNRFIGINRTVEITGEAYFEIKEDKTKPFKVLSKNQELIVLGTSFNINSYDPSVRTTLVTGSIQVANNTNTSRLQPGQQAVNTNGDIQVKTADIHKELAWKSNEFRFTGETLADAMQQIGRWYDVNVVFADEALQQAPVSGIINRSENLSVLLSFFERVGEVRFELREKTLIIHHK